jgi:hypothetical protein
MATGPEPRRVAPIRGGVSFGRPSAELAICLRCRYRSCGSPPKGSLPSSGLAAFRYSGPTPITSEQLRRPTKRQPNCCSQEPLHELHACAGRRHSMISARLSWCCAKSGRRRQERLPVGPAAACITSSRSKGSCAGGAQDPNLSQVALRFLNVMPYGVQLVPDCNLAGMIQRSLKSLDAKCGKSGKGISLLYSFCWLTWLPPSSLPEPGV